MFEHIKNIVICVLLAWGIARITGILAYVNQLGINKRLAKDAEKIARVLLVSAEKSEIRQFVFDYKTHLSDATVNRLIERIEEIILKQEEEKLKKEKPTNRNFTPN